MQYFCSILNIVQLFHFIEPFYIMFIWVTNPHSEKHGRFAFDTRNQSYL